MVFRLLSALALLALLSACAGGGSLQPRNLDNACSILNQKRGWSQDLAQVERKWGIPAHVIMSTIFFESKFVADARTPREFALGIIPMGRRSTAFGYAQALDGTWDEYRDDQGRRFARRDQFDDAVDFMGWYMAGSSERLGIARNDARNQYLAYHEGRTGYARGSFNRKQWLLRVASNVASRAETYRQQLATCRG